MEWICWRCYPGLTGRKLSSSHNLRRIVECFWCGGAARRAVQMSISAADQEEQTSS